MNTVIDRTTGEKKQAKQVHPCAWGTPSSDGILAALNPWLQKNTVSEIVLNEPGHIFVEAAGKFKEYAVPTLDQATLMHFFQLLAHENGQVLNAQKPLLSASLKDGSRIQVVLPPTAKHATFAIRRQQVHDFSLHHYAKQGVYQHTQPFSLVTNTVEQLSTDEQTLITLYQQRHWDAFIQQAIRLKKNIVLSGGTSSGKTTFLKACLAHIPTHERLIILEDTRELTAPHRNQVQLLASKGEQALAQVSLQDLLQCALRLRPDRIIVGEVRGKEILDFVGACATGHSGSFTSIHANNPKIAFMRMTQLYKQNNVPAMSETDIQAELHEVIDVIIQLNRQETATGEWMRQVSSIYYKCGTLR